MGLASSQARMLLLTARKSDLEYRAQMISQRKINLAMQTEQLATNYSNSMSNRVMKLAFTNTGNESVYENLSYSGITAQNGESVGDYLVVNGAGKYLVSGKTEDELLQSYYNVAKKLATEDGSINDTSKGFYVDAKVPQTDAAGNKLVDDEGNILYKVKTDDNGKEIKGEDGKPVYETQKVLDAKKLIESYLDKMEENNALSDSDYFQDALRNGSIYLAKNDESSNENGYKIVSWSGVGSISDTLDTTDDAMAQAEYEAKSVVLSNQDKMLDLELNQIETQHKAIETEYDSVKKVIQKNIEVSYKIFA